MTVVLRSGERNGLTVLVAAESGARVTQITDGGGREWLVDNGRADPPPSDLIEFSRGTRGGWDECIPSIAPCVDPNPDRAGHPIPDHGAFWMHPWRIARLEGSRVELDSAPIDHPLRIRKALALVDGSPTLTTHIRVTNTAAKSYAFLYSAHPLWNWHEPAVIEATGSTELVAGFGRGLPDLESYSWAIDPHGPADNFKYFLRWNGVAHLRFPASGAELTLREGSPVTPWLGVCVNRRGWPTSQDNERWIALEPTNSPGDSLISAVADGSAITLAPHASVEWMSSVSISAGRP